VVALTQSHVDICRTIYLLELSKGLSMSRILSKEEINSILSNVPVEKGFHFQLAEGRGTNVTAVSLEDFAEKLIQVDAAAVDFHYPRGDFQNGLETY
jgi:hypothetical protein